MLPYRLDTIQVYCPVSLGTRSFSLRYQIEVLRYGSSRLPFKSFPSFSQVYLSGGVPFASHLSLNEWDAGQALNALFKVSGSEKTGFPKKKEGQLKQTRVYTLHSSLVFLWVCPRRAPAIRGSNLGLWQSLTWGETDVIQLTLTPKMTTAQVVEILVTLNNSPVQDYVHPDDQTQPSFEMTPGFEPFTMKILVSNLLRTRKFS